MKITNFLLDAVSLFVRSDFFGWWFPVLFVLFLIALVPVIVRHLFSWR